MASEFINRVCECVCYVQLQVQETHLDGSIRSDIDSGGDIFPRFKDLENFSVFCFLICMYVFIVKAHLTN